MCTAKILCAVFYGLRLLFNDRINTRFSYVIIPDHLHIAHPVYAKFTATFIANGIMRRIIYVYGSRLGPLRVGQ